MSAEKTANVRLDKWLWAARFYKSRSLAAAAIRNGRVLVNDSPARSARTLVAGDRVRITRGQDVTEVVVLAQSDRRGPAVQAARLYRETGSSLAARALARSRPVAAAPRPEKKPDKRSRRQLLRLKGGGKGGGFGGN